MKLAKKIVAHVLMIAMLLSLGAGVQFKDTTVKAEGDYRSLAQNLPLDGTWTADQWLTENNEEQWYKFTVTDGGKLTLKIMSYVSEVKLRLATEDLSQYIIDNYCYTNGTDTAPGTKTYTEVLSAGTYYIKISKSSYYGKFKMCATFENYGLTNQGADSYDSPKVLPIDQTVTGAMTATDEEDWYRLSVNASGNYVIDITAYLDYMHFTLYNQDLSDKIGEKDYFGGKETAPGKMKKNYTLSAGTYYIKIRKGYEGKYLLSWSALTPENCTHDYSSTYVDATYLSQGYRLHTCKNCGHQYKDEFSSKKVLNEVSYPNVSAGKRKMTVTFWSVSDADGYQIRYSTNKKFKKAVKYAKVKSTKKTIKKLKRKKRYYVQVRAYKKVQGKTVYGKWSAKKNAKIK
ncbi:MAG TPA: hypothetical protein DEO89_00110 [Lachnospiraceae bacterium]|nr:hypothetical protein [Lachnospiraceae bacterium]